MTEKEIKKYLELMGYSKPGSFRNDDQLLEYLDKWENDHIAQRRYKDECFWKNSDEDLTQELTEKALEEIVFMKNDIKEMYLKDNLEFSY